MQAPPPTASQMSRGRTAAAVFLGGSVGALARYGLGVWMVPVGEVPVATLAANLAGSAVLGVLAGQAEKRGRKGWGWSMLGVGFAGAFTTFSTFALEALELLDGPGPLMAVLYAGGSVLAGLVIASGARRSSLAW